MALTTRNPHAIPSGPTIAGVNVAVWTIRLDTPTRLVSDAKKFLSPDERAKADAFRNELAQRNYVIAHAALRQILAAHLQVSPAEISFVAESQGKPALRVSPAGRLEFNLTHSRDLALVAIAPGAEVGVDVEGERPLPDALQLAERYFSAAESAALRELPAAEQTRAFFNLWTRKEALAKATGHGIANTLALFEIGLGAEATVKAIGGDARLAAQWSLHSFEPAPGYVAAVAARSPGAKFTFDEF